MTRRWLLGLLLLAGCTSFQAGRPLDQLPTPVPADQRIEVWSHGESYQLHAVTIGTDSVRGVRWWHAPECDSCRVVIARAAVDSVRTLGYDGGETGVLALVLAPVAFITFLVIALHDMGGS
ncbi:MAG TPA: hypothetical protein VF454_05310 [Gemmatimonadales bacterium]